MASSATLWTGARQAPLSVALSRQEYWSGFPFPSPGDLSDPGIEPTSLESPLSHQGSLYFLLQFNPQMVEADFLYQIGRGSTMEQSMYDLGKKKRRGMSRARTMTLYTLKPK